MNKIIFIILSVLFLIEFSYGKEFEFKQTKYINALNIDIKKTGFISFTKDKLLLKYSNENKVMNFRTKNILITYKNKEEILEYQDNIKLQVFYNLLKSIFTNNNSLLEDNFTIIKKAEEFNLLAKEPLNRIIKNIKYKKINNKLIYINIYFINKDRINIVSNN